LGNSTSGSSILNAKLNVSDTLTMLKPYFKNLAKTDSIQKTIPNLIHLKDSNFNYVTPFQLALKTFDTSSLSNRVNAKLNISDTTLMLSNRITRDTSFLSLRIDEKESLAHKITDIALVVNYNDINFPTTKAVKDYVDGISASGGVSPANAITLGLIKLAGDLTGTANFAQTRVPEEYQNYFAMVVGGFNILGGIISTIQQFLKITQLNESHRVSGIAWDKFYRNVKIELAKHPSERMQPGQMLKMSKEEFDRLMETSPTIPEKMVALFKTSFKHSEAFDKIVKPEICDVLNSTDNYRNPWYNAENREKNENETIKNKNAKEKRQQIINKMNILIITIITIILIFIISKINRSLSC
jgi:hypothetical protein